MRYRAVSGFGVEVAFLILYIYSDAVRVFFNYLVSLLFHIPSQDASTYVVPFAIVLMIASITLGILDYLNIGIISGFKGILSKDETKPHRSGTLKAEIFGEPENKFLVGGTLCFKAWYRGNLTHGFFTSIVRAEVLNTILDTGRDYEWLVDYNTNRHVVDLESKKAWDTGLLNGRGSGWLRKAHRSTWGHKIAFRYPPGKYTVTVMLFEEKEHQSVLVVSVKDLTFTVLDEKLMPLRGWDKDGNLIPPPRSMFVKNPRKRNWRGVLK